MALRISDVLTLTLPGFTHAAASPLTAIPTSTPASLFSQARWDAASSSIKLTVFAEIVAGTLVSVTAPASMGIAAPLSGSLLNSSDIKLSAAAREGGVPPTQLTASQRISSVVGSSKLTYSRADGLAPAQIDFEFTAVSGSPPFLSDDAALTLHARTNLLDSTRFAFRSTQQVPCEAATRNANPGPRR